MAKKSGLLIAIGLLLIAAALCLTSYNLYSSTKAGNAGAAAAERLAERISSVPAEPGGEELPDYVLNPEMDMPITEIDGHKYIGLLSIPSLSLELPVMSTWDYSLLNIAPCRYTGSVYLNDMVIAAHNYSTHFGRLNELSPGALVTFTDSDGNVFSYSVIEIETLSAYAVDEMVGGDWDLTLFTCTIGGAQRVTVRCIRLPDA